MWAPLYTTSVAPKLAARYLDEPKKIAVPAIWAIGSLLISLLAFFKLTLAPLGRFVDGRRATDAGRARGMAWLASISATASIGILGAAAVVTAQISKPVLAFGLVPWARWGGYLAIVAVVLGLWSVVTTIRARREVTFPFTSLVGFLLTGLAAIGMGSFILLWGLGPF